MYSLRDVAFLYCDQNSCYGGIHLNVGCQDLPAYIHPNISEHEGKDKRGNEEVWRQKRKDSTPSLS